MQKQDKRQAHIDALRDLPKEVSGINWEHYEKVKQARAKTQAK